MNGKMPLKSKIVLMSTYGNYLKLRYRLKVIGKEKVKDQELVQEEYNILLRKYYKNITK